MTSTNYKQGNSKVMQASLKAHPWLACAALLISACGARTSDDVGGKTSWLSSCDDDADCDRIQGAECIQHLCTKACETNGCGQVEGTDCVSVARSCLTEPSCLPQCDDRNDCARFGSELTCLDSVCVKESCARVSDDTEPDAEATATVVPNGTIDPTINAPTSAPDVIVDGLTVSPDAATTAEPTTAPEQSTPNDGTSTSGDVPTTPTDCAQFRDSVSQRPHPAFWGLENDEEPLLGEAGCEGSCGYVYTDDTENFDPLWRYDGTLVCPLQLAECGELEAALDANPARCNSVDDCLSFQALTAPCEPVYGPVPYFDSALFTVEERAAREEILAQIQQRGCRDLFDGYDGPTYELACEDNLCTIAMGGDICGGWPPDEFSDGGVMTDGGS